MDGGHLDGRAVERVGARLLALALALALALVLALAVWAPWAPLVLPLLVILGVGWAALLNRPGPYLAVTLGLASLLASRDAGVQPGELAFFVSVMLYVTVWYLRRLREGIQSGERMVRSRADVAAFLYMTLGIFGGAVLGLLFQFSPADYRAELVGCVPFFLYFPMKEACRREPWGVRVVVGALLGLGLFAAVHNGYYMKQAFQNATQLWQIADIRFNYGETFLSAGFLAALAVFISVRRPAHRVGLLVIVCILTAGLLLTKSRGFWVATILGGMVTAVVMEGTQRRRLALYTVLGGTAFVLFSMVFFGDYVGLLVNGIVRRFSTLSSATTRDISLVNRFIEASAALQEVRRNPILGYGWGKTYTYFTPLGSWTSITAFVHNGYVALLLKLGVWGLGLMLFIFGSSAWNGVRAARARHLPPLYRSVAAGTVGALVTFVVVATTSNPFTIPDQLLALTLVLAVMNGLSQRAIDLAGSGSGASGPGADGPGTSDAGTAGGPAPPPA